MDNLRIYSFNNDSTRIFFMRSYEVLNKKQTRMIFRQTAEIKYQQLGFGDFLR